MARKSDSSKKKEAIMVSLAEQMDTMGDHFAEATTEVIKFDAKERGWRPAGGRIRKQLQTIAVMCKAARKHISDTKREAAQ